MGIFLQDIIKDFGFDSLPYNWNSFNLDSYSRNKKLWDFQQHALENALKVLWQYFEHFRDYAPDEPFQSHQERKAKYWEWYQNNGLSGDLDVRVNQLKRNIYALLTDYYPYTDGRISYEHFTNRMSFWMATGSGKSLVIVKLVKILLLLIERGEIPGHDILFLTHRDDLIKQFKNVVEEVNYLSPSKLELRELKEYPEVKRQQSIFGIPIFYYRSDNLSDEQKEKIIDFRNYDNHGRWYIILDEAHKGDREDSKRQHIYSILSRNGFLFNFSATFTDIRDFATTAFEFNLASFIQGGYGKHISLLKQEIRAFRKKEEDYTGEEKQKIVLKSLILLAYVRKFYEKITGIEPGLYHKPLLLTLVNSVNTEDADLKLFFRELERIGTSELDGRVFRESLNELWQELKDNPQFMFESGATVEINPTIFQSLTHTDVLKWVYNSATPGEIEILRRPSNQKELAFQLKTSGKPFALIKIGDVSNWLKEELEGYEIQEKFDDESYFEKLNEENSEINILMGSRGFYEGWDSNRPNIINFINIGTGTDAKKFILQSVGRGVRIEPVANKRKRLLQLYNAKEVKHDLYDKIKEPAKPLEVLFIFGTSRKALDAVISELEQQRKEKGEQLSLFLNERTRQYPLLIPMYKRLDKPVLRDSNKLKKFPLTEAGFRVLKKYVGYISDHRVLLMLFSSTPEKLQVLQQGIDHPTRYFNLNGKDFRDVNLLLQRLFDFFDVIPEEFEKLKEVEEEIKHFKNITVRLEDISELKAKIKSTIAYPDRVKELKEQYGKISPEEYMQKAQGVTNAVEYEYQRKRIYIKYAANHYYIPMILSTEEKIDYITHIIKTRSEVRFVNDLERYLEKPDNRFKEFDWWFFSKLDESLDEVYIPYYNPDANKISYFFPDFIFWLKKANKYYIVFIDPKGTVHSNAYFKIEGYKDFFEDSGRERTFSHNGSHVQIKLFLRPEDVSKTLPEYRKYWFDSIEAMIDALS